MRVFQDSNKRRLIAACAGGVLALGLYKLYLCNNDREQFEDSNALVSLMFILIVAAFIYLLLRLISTFTSSKK